MNLADSTKSTPLHIYGKRSGAMNENFTLILGFKGLSDVQGYNKYLYWPTMPEIAVLKSLDSIRKSYFLYTSRS